MPKDLVPYDSIACCTDPKNWAEVTTGFIRTTRQTSAGFEFLERSKKAIKYIAYNPDPSDSSWRRYVFYTNDGSRMLGKLETRCGFDRGPKLRAFVEAFEERM